MRRRGACRLAILASHPIQYFTPLYRRLAEVPGLDVEVLYCRDFGVRAGVDRQFGRAIRWDTDQLSGYRHRFLRNVSPISDTFNPLHAVNPGAFARLLRGYDALWVNGYTYPSNYLALAAAALRGTRLLVRSELRLDPRRARAGVRARMRDALIRWWMRRADALLYIGRANRDAYLHYGADARKLFFTPYSAETERIAAALPRGQEERRELRHRWGIPADRVTALFVGKVAEWKHPEAMLHIARSASAASLPVHVVIAGTGPMEGALREMCAREGLDNVTFLGFVNQSDLPSVYATGDIFLFPSAGETWGLVLNEAMAAGMAPVVADNVGAVPDLITPGETGFVFPSADWGAMLGHVRALVADPARRASVGRAARARSERYSYEVATQGVVEALRAVGVYEGELASSGAMERPAPRAAAARALRA
jgi:glycosyltransferase involved in cell wall biosynthesis